MVDERGYCTDCDSYDCLHAQLFNAQAQAAYWKRTANERVVSEAETPSKPACICGQDPDFFRHRSDCPLRKWYDDKETEVYNGHRRDCAKFLLDADHCDCQSELPKPIVGNGARVGCAIPETTHSQSTSEGGK